MPIENKVSVGVGLGLGLASVAGLGVLWKLWKTEKPPTKWRKVGELSDLMCFPIKSAGAIRLNEMDCSMIGVQEGFLRDRIFMCVTLERNFVTGRTHPKMVLIQPKVEGNIMTLTAPEMKDIQLDVAALQGRDRIKTSVWGQLVDSVDCGDEIASWLSRYILGEETGLRLVYYPKEVCERDVREKNKIFETVEEKDCGALHDATSYNLINQSSVDDLNTKIPDYPPVTPQQFRPNFVVKGAPAFEEDSWQWMRIGGATFRNVKPCTRCIFTTVDPKTGLKNKAVEPLKELKRYRLFPKTGRDPVLGIHLGLRGHGRVKLGDAVYVEA
ncbi:mitochondrial amidoxime-reducing component 1 [Ctenocephalides felis]|uniref:mitochondrial amidoxime-reducing component 1 n=1 Tax=Ctenocephalides felis TaxID=7515 RepID=UPI000E6E1252|nr:mitochondrial amidoxime-reducing component 1 [Ctenocephalides felis]